MSMEIPTGLGYKWNGESMESFQTGDWDADAPRDASLVLFLLADSGGALAQREATTKPPRVNCFCLGDLFSRRTMGEGISKE